MTNQLIFVADSDPKNLQILKENLEASGFRIITAIEGSKVLEEIKHNIPDIILSEINLQGINGFQLLENLKKNSATSSIPLIFLTNQRDVQLRVRSFQLGAKDYMVKPLHVKEVIAHIRMVLRRMNKLKFQNSNNFPQFSGKLNEMNLTNLIETFSVESKTGVLTLNNGNNSTGQIFFRNGSIVNAKLGDVLYEKAIFQMFPWEKGFFNMVFKSIDVSDMISVSNLGILIEGKKKMEKRENLIKQFPAPSTAFNVEPAFKKITSRKKLPKDVKQFVTLLDGKRTIENIIEDSIYDDIKTLERLLRLYHQGFIKPTIAEKESDTVIEEIIDVTHNDSTTDEQKSYTNIKNDVLEQQEEINDLESISRQDIIPIIDRIKKKQSELIIPNEAETDELSKTNANNSDIISENDSLISIENEIVDNSDNGKATNDDDAKLTENIINDVDSEQIITSDIESETIDKSSDNVEHNEIISIPKFSKNEFLQKETNINKKIDIPQTTEPMITKKNIPVKKGKNQILTIGMDEDSLDEVLDILTNNSFQTKNIEALDNIKMHFGKIAIEQFSEYTLLGVFSEENFSKLISGLSANLVGILFTIDSIKNNNWDYISYLVHSIKDTHNIPFVVAVINTHEQTTLTIDIIRYKLKLKEKIHIAAWDTDLPSSINGILSVIVNNNPSEKKEFSKEIKNIVEDVTA